ncbi:NADAR family protein [Marinobacter sp. M216]|uniref:NADAR family protein n=1 Tax=Marinobacter albus TaxID=3030833 RepID=A0ABT7H988_9GAMM|nr:MULTISPECIES: NADAR family protein [unclassified Marinobacter]MBW7470814.1 NADAR family protein [Marinobacter sp. F4218]MDK9556916.1 NADAR family protein [Marinobacter sp. M216]
MSLFPADNGENDLFLSRTDPENPFGTHAAYSFELEGKVWPTVEHYFQAMKFTDENRQEKIRTATTPARAGKLGRKRHKSLRPDWKKVRETVMTRAVYTRCRTYPDLAQALLETGDQKIVENSNYDYFWGCGRDRRGHNGYGKVLMNVRAKLRQEQAEASEQ